MWLLAFVSALGGEAKALAASPVTAEGDALLPLAAVAAELVAKLIFALMTSRLSMREPVCILQRTKKSAFQTMRKKKSGVASFSRHRKTL